jgi:RNA polymerase sigma-70 factor (ECF subfamily)
MTTSPIQADPGLLQAARGGDEQAFQRIVEPHRGELHAHCYRMLGSTHDAEDALQETLLRAWRGLPRFEGRSSLRSWLYRIATNTSLNAVEKRPKRVLPVDYGPAADPHGGPGQPIVESAWVEPYPDERIALEDGLAGPEARYEQREAIELAFIAALQHLPPNQRAVLILREVLGFSASETAETLDTTTASVNSALQRARESVDKRLPEQSQQETLRELGDEGTRELVETYVDAWLRDDVDKVVELLTDDVTFAMPPLGTWFSGPEVAEFLVRYPMSGAWKWRTVVSHANGQPAIAFYTWDEDAGTYLPFALNVLTLRGGKVSDVVAFIVRSTEDPDADYVRFPEQPADARQLEGVFGLFGLPERLD